MNIARPTPRDERPVGELLRSWRRRRRLSQLDLALDADVSTRHLSCVETGRALPSREMLLRLAERLDVPLRERNRLMTAAGYAPATTVFGTPIDVTLSELALETFFPADAATGEALRALAAVPR